MTGSTADATTADAPTGERFDPAFMNGRLIEAEHLARYAWASQFAPGRRVLDAACGMAYGTAILAGAGASEAVGIDQDEGVVEQVRAAAKPGTRFDVGDLRQLPYEDGEFDLVVCFEAIEHVPEPEKVLDELARVLSDDGLLLVSTPNRDVYTPGNPFHLRELTPHELEAELSRRFKTVEIRRQHSWVASGIFDDAHFRAGDHSPLETVEVRKAAENEPGLETYTIGVAGNGGIPADRGLVSLSADIDIRDWSERLEAAEMALETAPGGEAREAADAALLHEELGQLREQLAASEAELARYAGLEAKLQSTSEALSQYDHLVARHSEVVGSTSWRLTERLRRLGAMVRRFRS